MEELFEKASRHKLRFKMVKGLISVEDLWQLSLEDLDELAKALNKELKESEEVSFIKKKSTKNTLLTWRFELVKYVINKRITEEEEAKTNADQEAQKATKKARLIAIIDSKEVTSLENKSIDELRKELEAL